VTRLRDLSFPLGAGSDLRPLATGRALHVCTSDAADPKTSIADSRLAAPEEDCRTAGRGRLGAQSAGTRADRYIADLRLP
jgi:hypothetical protein